MHLSFQVLFDYFCLIPNNQQPEEVTVVRFWQSWENILSFREKVGSYIYEKFGRSGLIVTMEDFTHELPLKEYAKIYFGESLVGDAFLLIFEFL